MAFPIRDKKVLKLEQLTGSEERDELNIFRDLWHAKEHILMQGANKMKPLLPFNLIVKKFLAPAVPALENLIVKEQKEAGRGKKIEIPKLAKVVNKVNLAIRECTYLYETGLRSKSGMISQMALDHYRSALSALNVALKLLIEVYQLEKKLG